MRFGRYEIRFGRYCRTYTTRLSTTIRCYLYFVWIIKKARPHDIDKTQQFPLSTRLEDKGRVYRYWKNEEEK